MRIFKFFFVLLFYNSYLYGEIVTVEGAFKHIGDISQKKACQLAEKRAKDKAIKKSLGLKISLEEIQKCKETDGKVDCEQNQISILSLNGEITESKIINKEEGLDELSDPKIYYCIITLQANVQSAFKEDNSFEFQVNLNEVNFRRKEKLKIDFLLSEPLYLNVFQFFPYRNNEQILKLFPNDVEKQNFIKSTRFSLPSKLLSSGKNIEYIIEFPKSVKKERVDEHLIFIASKNNIKWLDSYFSVEDLNKRLIEIGKNNIVRKEQKTYTIYK